VPVRAEQEESMKRVGVLLALSSTRIWPFVGGHGSMADYAPLAALEGK
jgi:hypothetical protein